MKRTLLLLLALCCLPLSALAAESDDGFSDVPADHWAAKEIARAAEAGVIAGYDDGSFRPQADVTAAHFCAFLSRSFLSDAYWAPVEVEKRAFDYSEQPETAAERRVRALNACLPALEGTTVLTAYEAAGQQWGDFVDRPLSRYDMAQMVYNVLREKDAVPSAGSFATDQVADWADLSRNYRAAVSACWDLGILKGQSDGSFGGENTLNRAQAAVVWCRMADYLDALQQKAKEKAENEGAEPSQEDASAAEAAEKQENPEFGLREGETVQQMMDRINAKTPRCQEGCLPNGAPRTEENVQALLEAVKEACPDGTVWNSNLQFNYMSPSMGGGKGVLAFGMAVSDYVFGEEAPLTQHRDFRTLTAGDVVYIKTSTVERVLVITAVDREKERYQACELVEGQNVYWSGWGPMWEFMDNSSTIVYSRR